MVSDLGFSPALVVFERQIHAWECHPMPQFPGTVVVPAKARLVLGSLQQQSYFFIKRKFWAYEELLSEHQQRWLQAFAEGDVVICLLTPEKYHYTHCPASGVVRDIYNLPGTYHSCHPADTVALATPFSKNRRGCHHHRYRRGLRFWSRPCRHD
jgi:phosphatidylserine decarboxylase